MASRTLLGKPRARKELQYHDSDPAPLEIDDGHSKLINKVNLNDVASGSGTLADKSELFKSAFFQRLWVRGLQSLYEQRSLEFIKEVYRDIEV